VPRCFVISVGGLIGEILLVCGRRSAVLRRRLGMERFDRPLFSSHVSNIVRELVRPADTIAFKIAPAIDRLRPACLWLVAPNSKPPMGTCFPDGVRPVRSSLLLHRDSVAGGSVSLAATPSGSIPQPSLRPRSVAYPPNNVSCAACSRTTRRHPRVAPLSSDRAE